MDSNAQSALIEQYLTFREISQGRSPQTSVKYRLYLVRLVEFCAQAGIALHQVTPDHLEAFTGPYVFKHMKMGPDARRPVVAAVRGFYKWLHAHAGVPVNPSTKLEYPKAPRKLPLAGPLDAAEKLMWAPDLSTFIGVRDAAMLGLLIGCGLRASGLVRLNMSSLRYTTEAGRDTLSLRVYEKGDKERMIPVPEPAHLLVRAYLGHPYLESVNRRLEGGDQVLFISTCNSYVDDSKRYGETLRLSSRSVHKMVEKYGKRIGLPQQYRHPHALRHLYGAELTEDDVDVLDRMALMGHADVKSNEIYSHIAQRKLRRIVDRSNPLAKITSPMSDIAKILERKP